MKRQLCYVTVLFLASTGVLAQGLGSETEGPPISTIAQNSSYEACDLGKLEPAIMATLNHRVEGVVMCALREVAKIKLAQPECESTRIRDKVDDLVRDGASMAIRYKAYLTAFVLAQPGQFAAEGRAVYTTDEEFFTALSQRLQSVALTDAR